MADNVMMKRIHHVSGTPKDGVMTYVIDAHAAVREHPDQWAFQPWPSQAVPAMVSADTPAPMVDPVPPAPDWRKEVDWKSAAEKAHATKRRKRREAREARDAAEAAAAG